MIRYLGDISEALPRHNKRPLIITFSEIYPLGLISVNDPNPITQPAKHRFSINFAEELRTDIVNQSSIQARRRRKRIFWVKKSFLRFKRCIMERSSTFR